jgi:glycosyltransferase involved in cell wall biosynthesis
VTETFVSIVAPLEGEGGAAVQAFVDETVAVLRGLVTHYEIILVDDDSKDDSVDRVRAMLTRYDFVRLLRLSRRFGEETAIAAGLDVAIGDYVIVMLPNMDPPSLIPEFLERARSGGDIVYGVREHRKTEPLWYRSGARFFYWVINGVLGAEMPEDSTQFRCMTRQVVNAVTQIRDPDRYLRVLTSYIGFRKVALPYAPINRNGRPTVRPKGEAIALARGLIIDHTSLPLRFVAWAAVVWGVLDVAWAAWLYTHEHPNGLLHAQSAKQFLVLAIVLAVMAEYLSGVLRRLRSRPAYYVSEEANSSVLLREERTNVVDDTASPDRS